MSAADANELVLETQSFKPQETEGHVAVTQDRSEDVSQPEKKAPVRKEHVVLVREAGKSLLPFARVQKIIKADKVASQVARILLEIPIVAKDATFLISLATEEFIKRRTEAGKMVAEREKRATVQHKDIVDPLAKRKQRGMGAITDREQQTIHQFVINPNRADDKAVSEQADVTMNEDGTMGIQGGDSDQDDF
ncbi:hypothetical protein C0989_011346 [Termitomyces sp. Mn162]|nr:hypothetical protein C0989_011346 [Termitomyces sp. Mn162]